MVVFVGDDSGLVVGGANVVAGVGDASRVVDVDVSAEPAGPAD